MTTITLTVAFFVLFGLRIGMEFLADKYEFFGQWLTLTTIALIVLTVVLTLSLEIYVVVLIKKLWNVFSSKREETPQEQAAQRKKGKERADARTDKRENRAQRKQFKADERDRIYRAEAFEKRLKK